MATSNYSLMKMGKFWVIQSSSPHKVVHKFPLSEEGKARAALAAIQLNEKKEPKGQ